EPIRVVLAVAVVGDPEGNTGANVSRRLRRARDNRLDVGRVSVEDKRVHAHVPGITVVVRIIGSGRAVVRPGPDDGAMGRAVGVQPGAYGHAVELLGGVLGASC